jgi:hypothetical protein
MIRLCLAFVPLVGTLFCPPAFAEAPAFPDAPPLYYDLAQTPPDAAGANIFLPKESKMVRVPSGVAERAARFEVRDDQARVVLIGGAKNAVDLGSLGIGWYRIDFFDANDAPLGWTSAAFLPPMPGHAREDSPVAVDVALSWTPPDTDRDRGRMTDIAARTGVRWVRDRLRWREIETAPGEYAPPTKYDRMAKLQHGSGMDVLQVFHDMPKWVRPASEPGQDRILPDLRAVHAFGKALARRFHGSVQAWEPWNEANCGSFGAWPPHLMCAWQKAAYLGFKDGDRRITVCWQPIAGINTPSLAHAVISNETWPYFDAYSVHSYDWNTGYAGLWRHARDAASGKPLWVTESDRGIHAPKDAHGGELDPRMARLKAQFIAQSYADSLAAGASRHFHFILGQYMETTVQFGLLRQDMTPRPGYAALAAAARALRGTHCIGSISPQELPGARIVAFRGKKRDVLVKWIENSGEWETRGAMRAAMPHFDGVPAGNCTDYLGRPTDAPAELTGAPVFEELPHGACDRLPLSPVPRGETRGGKPCGVVLQADLPRAETRLFKPEWTEEHDYVLPPGSETPLTVWVYNFTGRTVRGEAPTFALPDGWSCEAAVNALEVAPGERAQWSFTLKTGAVPAEPATESWTKLSVDCGGAGRPVAAFRVRLIKPNGEAQ